MTSERAAGARRKPPVRARGGRRDSGRVRTAVLCLLPAMLVLLPTCIVLASAMLPTAAALAIDRSRSKSLTISVGALNLCGAVPFVLALWRRGQGFGSAFGILGDLDAWLSALGGAAAGWMVYLAMPAVIARITAVRQQMRLAQLRDLQSALVEEWGSAVARESSPDQAE